MHTKARIVNITPDAVKKMLDEGNIVMLAGFQGETVDALSLHAPCPEFGESVGVHLLVYDHDDLRGALRPDARGRTPRGSLQAVRQLLGA